MDKFENVKSDILGLSLTDGVILNPRFSIKHETNNPATESRVNYIFAGYGERSTRLINAGYFSFIFDAYLPMEIEKDYMYFISTINKTDKTCSLYKRRLIDSEAKIIAYFAISEEFGDYTLLSTTNNESMKLLVNFNNLTTNSISQIQLSEGAILNPRIFKDLQSINGGSTDIKFLSEDKMYLAKKKMLPLKILGIGNSWTENAMQFLGDIFKSLGIEYILGRSYAGGATLQQYWNSIINGSKFEYFEDTGNGWSKINSFTVDKIVRAHTWDIITHQQQSGTAGVYSTFQPYLNNLLNWDKKTVNLLPEFFIHSTWSYPNGYVNAQFQEYYQSDTDVMYNAILDSYNQAMLDENIRNVMPCTPIIQQIRALNIPSIDTDGSHLHVNGQFACGCIWAEMILRKFFFQLSIKDISIINSTFKPAQLTEENAIIIRNLAKTIVENIKSYYPNQE